MVSELNNRFKLTDEQKGLVAADALISSKLENLQDEQVCCTTI